MKWKIFSNVITCCNCVKFGGHKFSNCPQTKKMEQKCYLQSLHITITTRCEQNFSFLKDEKWRKFSIHFFALFRLIFDVSFNLSLCKTVSQSDFNCLWFIKAPNLSIKSKLFTNFLSQNFQCNSLLRLWGVRVSVGCTRNLIIFNFALNWMVYVEIIA